MAQRARLLNALLADLYGPQRLIAEGAGAAGAALRSSEFPLALRTASCPPADTWLHVYAADLARAPDGRWWVLRRSHAGAVGRRAMRWRIAQIIARCCPDSLRDLDVRRCADSSPRCARSCCEQADGERGRRWRWC